MSKEKRKKKTLRSLMKYPSLISKFNSRVRQEYLDADYLHKLDDTVKNVRLPDGTKVTQLEFYAILMKEWNNGGVGKQSEAKKNRIHRTKARVKECQDRNNLKNNDTFGIARAKGLFVDGVNFKNMIEDDQAQRNDKTEDYLIDYLDSRKKLKKASNQS